MSVSSHGASKRLRRLAGIVGAIMLSGGVSQALASGALDPYLPASGVIRGHVIEMHVAPEDQAISKRFQIAVQGNMDWFKHYVTSNPPGVPLPYDPHMGITKEQYAQLLRMKAAYTEKAPVEIKIERGADGSVSFKTNDDIAKNFVGTHFGADEKTVATPFGSLDIFNAIHQSDINAPLGVWNGAEWARVSEDSGKSPSVKLAFGKRESTGEGIFYYQVAPYGDKEEQSLVVFYKLD